MEFFQKRRELIILKIKYMKIKNGRKKFWKRFKTWKKKKKKYICDFQQNETIRSFGESIYTRKAKIFEAE